MNIDYVYDHNETTYTVFEIGRIAGHFISKDSAEGQEVTAYLAEHPEALVPEPLPPPPTDAELEARAEAIRQALFAENDKPLIMYMRRLLAGDETARAGFEACNAYAEALRAINDTEGWYRNPQWPTKPEV